MKRNKTRYAKPRAYNGSGVRLRCTVTLKWEGKTEKITKLSTLALMYAYGSAVCNDLDVQAYLDDVLRRVLAGDTDWVSLAPHAWKAEHPESLRTYRQDERRQAADRKRVRRARRRKL